MMCQLPSELTVQIYADLKTKSQQIAHCIYNNENVSTGSVSIKDDGTDDGSIIN